MKSRELFEMLVNSSPEVRTMTCDRLIAGDGEKEMRKVGVCFKLTAALVAEATEKGIDTVITHEPTFGKTDIREEAMPTDRKKWELIDKSGIAVYRFHDHAHLCRPDYIHAGFIRNMGLKIAKEYESESLGVCRYELEEATTAAALADIAKEKLGIEYPRIAGDKNAPVKTVCLGLGSVGMDQIAVLENKDCDLFITGEVGEVKVLEYVRDMCYFGNKKAVLVLGHFGSEYAGMRLLAEELREKGIDAEFLYGGEVY